MNYIYYRANRGRGRKSLKGWLKSFKFLYPIIFVIILVLFITALLRVWGHFASLQSTNLKNSATIYVASGVGVQKMSYGTSQFLPVITGDVLLEGDTVRTLQNSSAVLNFDNDLVLRLDQGTTLKFESINSKSAEPVVEMTLVSGQVWSKVGMFQLNLATNYLAMTALNTTVNVNAGLPEYVSVLSGSVLVDVIVDKITVNEKQQFVLTNENYQAFQRRETPRVLTALSNDFLNNVWFKWNLEQDLNPTDFSTTSDVNGSLKIEATQNDLVEEVIEDDDLSGPVVVFPVNGQTLAEERIEIIGTVPENTQAVVVTSFESGEPTPYVLKEFKPGDLNFKYIAVYTDDNLGNLRLGANRFEIVSITADAVESNPTILEFILEPKTTQEELSLEFDENLEAPRVVSINGEQVDGLTYNLVNENRAEILGSIGKWAKSIVINGYKLQRYEPYSGVFNYILSESFKTLQRGENIITAYGFDKDGRRGLPMKLVVNW